MKKGSALLVLSVILFMLALFGLATAVREEVDVVKRRGLKNIIEEIWEGKN